MPIPDLQSNPEFDGQAVGDSTDAAAVSAAFSDTGILSGCVVSALSTPSMTVQMTAGSVAVGGSPINVAAASVTLANASSSDRRDIVVVSHTAVVSVVEGTPCGTANWSRTSYTGFPPVKPAIPANSVFLADIYVSSSTTVIANTNIEPNTTTITLGSGVVSFNTRVGAVTLSASDVESVFTTAGQVIVGTGAGAGELLAAGSVGTILTSNGATSVPSWKPAAASVNAAGIESTFTTAGQLYVGTGSATGEQLAVGSVGTVLTSAGSSTVPQWLPPAGGGSASAGVSSFNTRYGAVTLAASDVESTFTTPGQVFVGTGSGAGELLAVGSVGTVLTSIGSASVPSWQAPAASGVASVTAPLIEKTFIAAGQLYVGTGVGTGEQLAVGSVGTVLTSTGSSAVPSWQPTITSVTAAEIEATFTAGGQLYVGTGSGTGELLAVGSVGTVLLSNGTGVAPSWQSASVGGNMNTTVYDPAGVSQQLVGTTATQTISNKRIVLRILSTSAPGATPSIDTDNYDVVDFTGLAANITSMSTNLTGTPGNEQMLRISFTDNGTARTITWGSSFENSGNLTLPGTTVVNVRLDTGFFWNPVTSAWRIVAIA